MNNNVKNAIAVCNIVINATNILRIRKSKIIIAKYKIKSINMQIIMKIINNHLKLISQTRKNVVGDRKNIILKNLDIITQLKNNSIYIQ